MRKLLTVAISVLALCCLASADQTSGAKAKTNLDGKVYMGYLPVNEEFLPDANGTINIPGYVAFNQVEDRFCCVIVTMFVNDERPGLPEVVMYPLYGTKGQIKKKNLKCTISTEIEGQTINVQMTGTEQANGNILCSLSLPFGEPVPLTLVPVNSGAKKYSGIYVGKIWAMGQSEPGVNNFCVSLTVEGDTAAGMTLFFPPDVPELTVLEVFEGALNTSNGAFSYNGGPPFNIVANGTIVNGQLQVEANVNGVPYVAQAFHMGDMNWANPNIGKKPNPKKLLAGKKTTVHINQTQCIPGGTPHIKDLKLKASSIPAAKTPVIYLENFSVSAKMLELVFVVAEEARGTFKLEFVNPSGKSGLSKKFKFK